MLSTQIQVLSQALNPAPLLSEDMQLLWNELPLCETTITRTVPFILTFAMLLSILDPSGGSLFFCMFWTAQLFAASQGAGSHSVVRVFFNLSPEIRPILQEQLTIFPRLYWSYLPGSLSLIALAGRLWSPGAAILITVLSYLTLAAASISSTLSPRTLFKNMVTFIVLLSTRKRERGVERTTNARLSDASETAAQPGVNTQTPPVEEAAPQDSPDRLDRVEEPQPGQDDDADSPDDDLTDSVGSSPSPDEWPLSGDVVDETDCFDDTGCQLQSHMIDSVFNDELDPPQPETSESSFPGTPYSLRNRISGRADIHAED